MLSAAIVGAVLEGEAYALQGGEDPALLPVLLDKRFGSGGRHQLSLSFSTSVASKFIEATGALGTYTYGFGDIFGLEIAGGYFFGRESSIMEQVRLNFTMDEPPLSDLYQLQWLGAASLMVVPIYGKMSFASEVDPSFDLYFLAGGGATGLRRQVGQGATKVFETAVGPLFNAGLGFRFYFSRLVALRFEFRDYFYPDPAADASGLTFNLHVQAGIQFAFGGDE